MGKMETVMFILLGILYQLNANVILSDDTTVRLVDGATHYEGPIEVYMNERWGSICDDFFDTNAASSFYHLQDTTIEDSESGNVTNAHGKLTTYTAAPEAGNYYRRCQKGTFLNPVNNCTRKAIRDLHAKVLDGSLNSKEALTKLKKETNALTTATENLPTAGDLQNVNQILDEIIDIIEINSSTIENDTDKGVGAVSVLTTIDRFLSKVVNSSDGNFTMEVDKPNLYVFKFIS
ncbi:hypothetical protein MAR_018003 [Mya arenaria]|uniref:SRCR domain-containing protein n=1 Tax=Mya arenaria TaxID=6604 RepID=A0ABY7EDE6_MYAAR|nr:hypothetical protein MAR_018003 [Mya arenaria]